MTSGSAGLPPNGIGTNPTFWYNGDVGTTGIHYQGLDSTTTQATSNGDPVNRVDSDNSVSRVWASNVGVIPAQRKIPAIGSANGMRLHGTSNGQLIAYTKPSAGANPSTRTTVANLFTSSNAIIVCAVKVDDAGMDTGTTYTNEILLGDADYMGLYFYKSGSDVVFKAYNFSSGGENPTCTATEALGQWAIITYIHRSNLVKIRKNGVEIASVSSVATASTAGNMVTGAAFSTTDFTLAQLCTYNAAVTDANILEVERWFGAKVGLSF